MVQTPPQLAGLIAQRHAAETRLKVVREKLLPLLLEQAKLEAELSTHDKYLVQLSSSDGTTPNKAKGELSAEFIDYISKHGASGAERGDLLHKFGDGYRTVLKRLKEGGVVELTSEGRVVLTSLGQDR